MTDIDSRVRAALDALGVEYTLVPCDPELADTAAFCATSGYDPGDSAIVQAVVHMGQALQMTTLAEGVETAHHVIELRELDCDIAQGFHFARPVPAEQFAAMLAMGDDWLDETTG